MLQKEKECKVEGCNEKRHGRGMCRNHYNFRYKRTKIGKILETYASMRGRVKGKKTRSPHLYKGLELLDRNEFIKWSLKSKKLDLFLRNWKDVGYIRKYTPSINRKDPDKGYVIGNIEWIPLHLNCLLGRMGRIRE